MIDPKNYFEKETLKNGQPVIVRAIRPTDREDFVTVLQELDERSIYLRFFYPKKRFSDKEVTEALDVDFVRTVALITCIRENGSEKIIGGGRYIVFGNADPPDKAEIAFMVRKGYQGLGMGSMMLRHLAAIAKERGILEFHAEVMSDNTGMLTVFRHSGFKMSLLYESGVAHVMLSLAGD